MAWCKSPRKWLVRVKFFPSKVPEFLHVLFNLVEKHSTVSFFDWNSFVRLCCVHCARFDILSLFFSETKCKSAKKIQGNGLLLNWKAHTKIQALLKEKKLPEKVTYIPLAPSHSIIYLGKLVMVKLWVEI